MRIVSCLFVLGVCQPVAKPRRSTPTSEFFLWLTDFHIDPYYGTKFQQCHLTTEETLAAPMGVLGCDPPFSLLASTLEAAGTLVDDVRFVLHTGDFARHSVTTMPDPESDVRNIIHLASKAVQEAAPEVSRDHAVEGTLGNDDFPLDYGINITTNKTENSWFADLGKVMFSDGIMSQSTLKEYSYGGYFDTVVGGLHIVCINTMAYSRYAPQGAVLDEDPFWQFEWLRGVLENATLTGRPVWIVGHIPPGIETYAFTELWHPTYLAKFMSLVQDPAYAHIVAAQLYGHVHADEFRLLPLHPAGAGPTFVSGALSPVYDNNPSFRLMEYEPATGRMLGYTVYYADITEDTLSWRFGYDALDTYPTLRAEAEAGGLSDGSMWAFAKSLASGGPDWKSYTSWYKAQISNTLVDADGLVIEDYLCALAMYNETAYQECAGFFREVDYSQEPPSQEWYRQRKDEHRSALQQRRLTARESQLMF